MARLVRARYGEAWHGRQGIAPGTIPAGSRGIGIKGTVMSERRPISELGRWNGMVWEFYEPFTMPSGHVAEKIDLSMMQLPDDVSPADVIEALTDPDAVAEPADDLGDQFTPIHLPRR